MLTTESFVKAVEAAIWPRAASKVCREAGLPQNAISSLRSGVSPSLKRAIELAEAAGIELYVRRKGEAMCRELLEVAIVRCVEGGHLSLPEGDVPALVTRLMAVCSEYESLFKAEDIDAWEHSLSTYRTIRMLDSKNSQAGESD